MKTQNPLIGRSRKSFGTATFYTLNGENIVRTKAETVSNPNTPAQEAQRVRFSAFTAAANSASEADLITLFESKQVGRNRRSMLQSQIAPAYSSRPSTDPTSTARFEPTFDIAKLNTIGSGAVGYIGDFVEANAEATGVVLTAANLQALIDNMVLTGDETNVLIVMISEDGCIIKIGANFSMSEVNEAISEGISLTVDEERVYVNHGNKVYCYAFGAKVETVAGFGSFIIKKQPQKTGRDKKHNTPVSN